MHIHRWITVERIGRVVTQRCSRCGRIRTRVRGAVSDSPGSGIPECRGAPENGSAARTAPPRSKAGDAVQHRTALRQLHPDHVED